MGRQFFRPALQIVSKIIKRKAHASLAIVNTPPYKNKMNDKSVQPSLHEILESMKRRIPWGVATKIFRENGIKPGRGWDKTFEKLGKYEASPEELSDLIEALEQHNQCGEKYAKFYYLSDEDHKAAIRKFLDFKLPETEVQALYPSSIEEHKLDAAPDAPVPVKLIKSEDGVGLVFSSIIHLTVREPIVVSKRLAAASKIVSEYDELIGLKRKLVQTFNVIWLSHNHSYLEIRTDAPDGITSDLEHGLHSVMRSVVHNVIGTELVEPIDLAPLIESMSDDPSEGVVVELGFVTSTGSVKNEKMRRQGDDLRTEIYHKAGKKALPTKIEPFKVSLRWALENGTSVNTPELSLVGTARGRHTATGKAVAVSAASISGCRGISDYEHVVSRIFEHLENNSPKSK